LLVATGAVVSAAVIAALGLVLSGYQVLVVRSASMAPTIAIGDVVLVDAVPASSIKVGDVVTRPASPEWGESLTHRVQRVTVQDAGLRVETRGDANQDPERWTVPADATLGRQVGQIPSIGRLVLALRSNLVQAFSALVLLLAGVLAIRRGASKTGTPNPVPNGA
jgi:signal peptidase